MKKHYFSLLIMFISLFFLNCNKGKIDPYYKSIIIDATYNYLGSPSLPTLTINSISINMPIPIATGIDSNGYVYLKLKNIRFQDNSGTYHVLSTPDSITVEEKTTNLGYTVDVEDTLFAKTTQSLSCVLVLDNSGSLENNVDKIKTDAKSFIDIIAGASQDSASVGLVVFSTNIRQYPLTKSYTLAKNFIDTCVINNSQTALFEAVNTGLDILSTSTAQSQAIVTFTDGINNYWGTQTQFSTDAGIIQRLTGTTAPKISSYSIGFTDNGGVDPIAMNQLAMNGGFYEPSGSYDQIQNIFNKVANSVASTYTLTYKRNPSIITNKQIRFIIKSQLL